MPTLWFVPDGRASYTDVAPGLPLSFEEATQLFATEEIRYVGTAPPSLRPDDPSEQVENVVLQLDEGEGTTMLLPQAGYYWVPSLRPEAASERLRRERARH